MRPRTAFRHYAAYFGIVLVAAGGFVGFKLLAASSEAPVSSRAGGSLQGRMIKPREVLKSEEALTVVDLGQLLRTGLGDREILEDVRRRGLVEALNESGEQYLQSCRASAALIQGLKNYDYVLTDTERQNYYARTSARLERSQAPMEAQRAPSRDPEQSEHARLLELQRQSIANAEKNQRTEANRVAKMDAETAYDRRRRDITNDRSSQTTAVRSIISGAAPVYVQPVTPRYPNSGYPNPNYPRTVPPAERQSTFGR